MGESGREATVQRRRNTIVPGNGEHEPVYKVLRAEEAAAFVALGVFAGSPDDRTDGFVHLSARDQVTRTLKKHFSAETQLFLAVCDAGTLGAALLWEASGGERLYPHLYRPLRMEDVIAIFPIPDGREVWAVPDVVRAG